MLELEKELDGHKMVELDPELKPLLELNDFLNRTGWTCQKHIPKRELHKYHIDSAYHVRQNKSYRHPLIVPLEETIKSEKLRFNGCLIYFMYVQQPDSEKQKKSISVPYMDGDGLIHFFKLPVNYTDSEKNNFKK